MSELKNAPNIEIIDNEKNIDKKIINCESNSKTHCIRLEGLKLLNIYDPQLDNHDIDLAFDKNNHAFHIICDTVVLNTSLNINNLDKTLSNIIQYIKIGEDKRFSNLGGLMKGYDLLGNPNKRILVKNGIGGTTEREQILLNTNKKNISDKNKKFYNNISEDMYVFLQNILDPDGDWEVDGVCESNGVNQECIDTLGSGNGVIVNKIKNIREATPEESKKFN